MKRLIKTELWKVFHSTSFWITLCIGTVISLVDVYTNWNIVHTYDQLYHDSGRNGFQGLNLFVRWIDLNMDTLGYAWFFFLFPLLAALAYGWSLNRDRCGGYIKHIYTRTSRRRYFWTKWSVSSFCGGMTVLTPLFLNLLLNALVCPACLPLVSNLATPMFEGDFFSALYYTHPWLHAAVCLATNFLWGAAIASISFASGYYLRNMIGCVLVPQIFFVLIDFILVSTEKTTAGRKLELSPLQLLHASTLNSNPASLVFGEILVLLTSCLAIAWVKGRKDEVL
jgi:hypothetical protein